MLSWERIYSLGYKKYYLINTTGANKSRSKWIASGTSHILDSFYQYHKHLYRVEGGGGEEPQRGELQWSSAIFKMKWPTRRLHYIQTVTKYTWLKPWPVSSTSQVMISSKVAACTSQPVAFNGHPALVDVWQASETSSAKADPSTFGSGVLVIS